MREVVAIMHLVFTFFKTVRIATAWPAGLITAINSSNDILVGTTFLIWFRLKKIILYSFCVKHNNLIEPVLLHLVNMYCMLYLTCIACYI